MNDNCGGFLAGLVVGTLGGAAVALFSSPRPGRENRALVARKLPILAEEAPTLIDQAAAELRHRLEAGREAYGEAAAETRQRMHRELDEAS